MIPHTNSIRSHQRLSTHTRVNQRSGVLILLLFSTLVFACSDSSSGLVTTKNNDENNGSIDMGDDASDNNKTDMKVVIPPGCGNGILEAGEACDDGEQNSDDTADACRTNCRLSRCGDGVQDAGEGCDSGAMNSDMRANRCRTDCQPAGCGDGVIDDMEDCDSDALRSQTCPTQGFSAGSISCDATCHFDTSLCTRCGDDMAEGADEMADGYEACDGTDLRMQSCDTQGFAWGNLKCASCQLDDSQCHADPAVCGNDTIEDIEVCDGTDLAGQNCTNLGMGFSGGSLSCVADCTGLDFANCYTCGNGILEPGELCDDGNTVGDFTCSSDCQFACEPGLAECGVNGSTFCNVDSQGTATVVNEECDAVQGVSCEMVTGRCSGACSPGALGTSYIGCQYYPTITANQFLPNTFFFAVSVANSGMQPANITVTQGGNPVTTAVVPPGDVAIVQLPWVANLKAGGATLLTVDGAYRLRADQPVTVYQYNPLDYRIGNSFSYTNDASLLLPTNTWSGNYVVVGRQTWVYTGTGIPSFYAITAKEDNTQVVLTPSATGGLAIAGAGVAANGTGRVTLNAGDVLQVTHPTGADPTGDSIVANKPIQVIAGVSCTNIPSNIGFCDHIEEAMPPLETVGLTYLVTEPLINANTGKARMVRVVATQANTTLVYDPPQAGAPTTLTNAGDYLEIAATSAIFKISGDKKIMVAQYMQGQDAGGNTGDPAMTLAVPIEQYRSDYIFHAPTNYEANYVNVTAPTGAMVSLDDGSGAVVVSGWTTIGATGYDYARVQLSNSGDGNYTMSSMSPFGITVYGYGQYTSYWYPGGLDLKELK